MPTFNLDRFNITIEDFLDECSIKETEEIVTYLFNRGWIKHILDTSGKNVFEIEWDKSINTLSNSRLCMSNEEIETIKQIANKY